ncbi:MAG TPA: hypothetical protein VM935_09790 [Chitinophagaceae bacterium]|jgi:hypothetical protein|nr:hypothetical protein [Chitinophagaceae bacterium]
MIKWLPIIIVSTLLFSCKSKKSTDEPVDIFPALQFIKSQVAHVDTSVYRIIKIVKTDSLIDTSYINRERFKAEAKDFLSIPDIASGDLKDDYVETKLYDKDLDQVSLSYMPKGKAEITRQEVLIKSSADGDKVTSIYINRTTSAGGTTTQKIMFWQIDKSFRIVTITGHNKEPEKTVTVDVVWNGFQAT